MTDYTKEQYMGAIEAVLFTMGNSIEEKTLMDALEIGEEELSGYIRALSESYEQNDRGIRIIRLDDAYQLCTKTEYYDALIRVATHPVKPVLTEALLEVLSIIAYKQPVTRSEIERIRGVSSDYAVNRLIEYRLVEEAGRLDAPGRPILFRTSEEFLRKFGLSSVRDLPELSEDALTEARLNVLKETGFDGQMSIEEYFAVLTGDEAMKNEEASSGDEEGPVDIEI